MILGRFTMIPIAAAAMLAGLGPGRAQTLVCGPFTAQPLAAPAPRTARWPVHRFQEINARVRAQPYRVLFFGDSITEDFNKEVWRQNLAPRGVLNAGVSGDNTEHLLWRLEHGNLAGPPPTGVILLIGTNDVGHGRPPALAAEGVRADLLYLRRHLPRARILLLGLWPREASPEARLRRATVAVNRLISRCGGGHRVVYADIGGVLLDARGRLDHAISHDFLHFTRKGYERLAPRLDALVDALVAGR